ncbi:MAG: metal-dependent transcriptional regulator [Anaerolineae bacterium]|nr:metal-dependent transcriptional regulator [Anaerolineae bacterium]
MIAEQILTRSEEDYVKAIYNLTLEGEPASTLRIATSLSVAPASVTNMLQKLAEAQPQLVLYQKHRGVLLTEAGRLAAMRIIRRHRLIETFLYEVMGYSWEQVHAEAEVLEHVISPYFEERLAIILSEPILDPHGEPIPNRNGEIAANDGAVQLSQVQAGQRAEISRVISNDQALLAYICQSGLQPGIAVNVLTRNPLDGTLQVALNDSDQGNQVLGEKIAGAIWVLVKLH